MRRARQPYADPYVAGVGLGLVLLAAFVIAGRGLGASGAFAAAAASAAAAAGPRAIAENAYFARYLADGPPWTDWLVVEIAGAALGGAASAWLAGRAALAIERGPRMRAGARLACAFAGGAAMGLGAMLARGCTSGQALTGGALLSAGSWAFMAAVFVAGFASAPLARRAWR